MPHLWEYEGGRSKGEILRELEKMSLVPVLTPTLKISGPVMGYLPKGWLGSTASNPQRQDALVGLIEKMGSLLLSCSGIPLRHGMISFMYD